MNDKLDGRGLIEVLPRNLPEGTEETHEGLRIAMFRPRFESTVTVIQV
jgi:hypothetical protein